MLCRSLRKFTITPDTIARDIQTTNKKKKKKKKNFIGLPLPVFSPTLDAPQLPSTLLHPEIGNNFN